METQMAKHGVSNIPYFFLLDHHLHQEKNEVKTPKVIIPSQPYQAIGPVSKLFHLPQKAMKQPPTPPFPKKKKLKEKKKREWEWGGKHSP